MNPRLTLFTPTYNRERLLTRLYESLSKQTVKEFEWLVIDDGSEDSTQDLIESYISCSRFPIRYYRQSNQGKHVAHNNGALLSRAPLFLCVDSDDWLYPNSVETILSRSAAAKNHGLIFQKELCTQNLTWPLDTGKVINLADIRMKYNYRGETAIVFQTGNLRKFPFPIFENERLCYEEIAYNSMYGQSLFVACSDRIYGCEYQSDGITKNLFRLWKENPVGAKTLFASRYETAKRYQLPLRIPAQLKSTINMGALSLALKENPLLASPNKLATLALLPMIILFAQKRYAIVSKHNG